MGYELKCADEPRSTGKGCPVEMVVDPPYGNTLAGNTPGWGP